MTAVQDALGLLECHVCVYLDVRLPSDMVTWRDTVGKFRLPCKSVCRLNNVSPTFVQLL